MLKGLISKKVKFASAIQYDFDSSVLSIKKNFFHIQELVPYELIRQYSLKIKKRERFKDWYSPNISLVPRSIGVFFCLISNFSWDIKLRTIYRNGIVVFMSIAALVMVFFGFVQGTTIRDFILEIFIPLMPLIIFTMTEIIDNHKIISKKEKLRNLIDSVWHKILGNNISEDELNSISKECLELLYQLRIENPLIFYWVYKLTKKSSQDETDYTIDKFIEEYQKRPLNKSI